MSKHRLRKPPPPRRFYAPQEKQVENFGALGGTVSLTMAGLACLGCIWGVPVIARSAPPDLFAAPVPGVPLAQRPIPGLLPGSGAGLRTVLDGWLDVPHRLNAGVASEPEVLKAALSGPLDLSVVTPAPVGRWIGGRWVPSDHVVRPPCPSPILDPAGFAAWWQKWFPGHPIPAPPVTTPPAPPAVTPPATTPVTPPAAPPAADAAPAPVETVPAPTAPAEPKPQPVVGPVVVDTTPVVDGSPVQVDPPAIDPPSVDVPPVTVDLPVVDPVTVDPPALDLPPVDLPPVSVPPVDVSPVTDPVADALPDPVGDVVDDVASVLAAPTPEPAPANATPEPVEVNSVAPDATQQQDAKTGAAESPVELSAPLAVAGAEQERGKLGPRTTNSTSGNGESYVGKHRVENGGHLYRARGEDRRSDGQGRGASSRGFHRVSEAGSSRGDGSDHGKRGGKHRSDRVSESKHESKSHKSDSHSKSHSSSKSHSGGGKSHSSHGGGGGHRGH